MTMAQERFLAPERERLGVFLALSAAALAMAAFVWFALPHEREVSSLGIFLVKLVPFVLATEAVASMPLRYVERWGLWAPAVPFTFLVYFTYFVPRTFYHAGINSSPDAFDALYYNILVLTPFLILSLVLAYRLGGGHPSRARRLSYAMILLMISGIEDLAFITVNDLSGTPFESPEVWDWASHMIVRLGRAPTTSEAYVFIGVHVALALAVLFVPGSWVRRVLGRRSGEERKAA